MSKKNVFTNLIEKIEYYLPMSFGSFVLFIFTLYTFFIVGRSIWSNYNSNKSIDQEEVVVEKMRQDIIDMQNEINYEQTSNFKEKVAREKLAYIAPGEKMIVLPLDRETQTQAENEPGEVQIKTPNYYLWWRFLFEDDQ